MTEKVMISKNVLEQISQHVRACYPNEGCGLLFYEHDIIKDASPLANETDKGRLHNHYLIDPMKMYELECEKEKKGLLTAGVYHSHPDKPAVLSFEDNRLMIPELIYLILSVDRSGVKEVKAYVKPLETMTEKELNTYVLTA